MRWAWFDGQRSLAYPRQHGNCPQCGGEVIAKCGSIVQWHWAHKAQECDLWSEPESDWHLNWKNYFPCECQEVVIGNHRADISLPNGVIELQSSVISPEEIREREEFYGPNMIWILEGEKFKENIKFRNNKKHTGRDFWTFRWKWPRKSWWHAQNDVLIDMGESLFYVKKIHHNVPCGGWGYWIEKQRFINHFTTPLQRLGFS